MFVYACLLNEIDTSNVYPLCVSVGEGERVCVHIYLRKIGIDTCVCENCSHACHASMSIHREGCCRLVAGLLQGIIITHTLSLARSLSHKYEYLHAHTLAGGAMDGAPALKEEGQGRGSIGGARGKRSSSSWRQGLLPERGRHKTPVESYCVQVMNTLLGVFWHKKRSLFAYQTISFGIRLRPSRIACRDALVLECAGDSHTIKSHLPRK